MKLKNLTYVYHSGRVDRYTSSRSYPEEFFYGLNSVKENFENTDIIEFDNELKSKNVKIIFEETFKIKSNEIDKKKYKSEKPLKIKFFI